MKNIIIVGGSYGAIGTAHRVLKNAKAALGSQATTAFKVTLVTRDSHFWWNFASPRAIIPGQFTDEQLSLPLADGFRHYVEAGLQFELVVASLVDVDVEAKRIQIEAGAGAGSDGEGKRQLDYDYLVLATGSSMRATEVPFKSRGSTEATMAALHDFQNRLQSSKTVVIVGGGPTGVEVAGEIKCEYGEKKDVILVSPDTCKHYKMLKHQTEDRLDDLTTITDQ